MVVGAGAEVTSWTSPAVVVSTAVPSAARPTARIECAPSETEARLTLESARQPALEEEVGSTTSGCQPLPTWSSSRAWVTPRAEPEALTVSAVPERVGVAAGAAPVASSREPIATADGAWALLPSTEVAALPAAPGVGSSRPDTGADAEPTAPARTALTWYQARLPPAGRARSS